MIELDIDADEAFDYEDAEKAKYNVTDLKNMLENEIRLI